ncbi:MAG TPA: hypothetical protein VFK05_38010 [Polyangiaceae bacterium]|nr:hypothetical protein [Polyangiaceae bacterium]
MKRLVTPLLCLGLSTLAGAGCAKKEPRPLRTEPWLAHPPASTSASGAAQLPSTRYVLAERSVIRFEIPGRHGNLEGSVSRVSGELAVALSDLSLSRGLVRVELGSLEIHADHGSESANTALLERARTALELPSDPHAPAVFASFDLSAVEDAVPALIEPVPERAPFPATPFSRRAQFTAVGNLLLHGFRVVRRAPLSAEFSFTGDRQVPSGVLIRSRSPFVVSLEAHAITALAPESAKAGREKASSTAPARARDVRVSVELYGTKSE